MVTNLLKVVVEMEESDKMKVVGSREANSDYDDEGHVLSAAARSGDLEQVKRSLQSNINVNDLNGSGGTALVSAAYSGHVDVVKLLLERGADVEVMDGWGQTPLVCAAYRGSVDIVKLLLERGAAVGGLDGSFSVLMLAARKGHKEVVQLLLDAGAPLEGFDRAGQTAFDVCQEGPVKDLLRNILASASAESKRAVELDAITAAAIAVAEAEADLKIVRDALSPELYEEFVICSEMPFLLQRRSEHLTRSLLCALRERRIDDAKAFKEERAALGYTPCGVSASEMRGRLEFLVSQLERRNAQLAIAMDHGGSNCCHKCLSFIVAMLNSSEISAVET